jgi:hypothetical protein
MKKYIILFSISIIVIFSTRYFIFTKHLERQYPMSYTYNSSLNEVRKNVSIVLSKDKYHGSSFEIGYDSIEKEMNNITDNENRNHFFINRFAWFSSGENSKIYYNWWGKLKLIPSYHIILDSLSKNQTKIIIESFPQVEAGTDFSLNHMLPYVTSRKVSVKPSTIEEYEIIWRVGQQCGEKNMPVPNEE